ncbi:hypothetical protein [Aureliella helgolandensis]|uniref:hypothetical protein n=1 Tax=Aureliella helgolandensis TaxID=2527968 RepID=UPI0011A3AB38|nr:hypothetical protein [Aureliella helgolandensis]
MAIARYRSVGICGLDRNGFWADAPTKISCKLIDFVAGDYGDMVGVDVDHLNRATHELAPA